MNEEAGNVVDENAAEALAAAAEAVVRQVAAGAGAAEIELAAAVPTAAGTTAAATDEAGDESKNAPHTNHHIEGTTEAVGETGISAAVADDNSSDDEYSVPTGPTEYKKRVTAPGVSLEADPNRPKKRVRRVGSTKVVPSAAATAAQNNKPPAVHDQQQQQQQQQQAVAATTGMFGPGEFVVPPVATLTTANGGVVAPGTMMAVPVDPAIHALQVPYRVQSKHDEKWNKAVEDLLKYKETHGNTLVPQCYDHDPKLGRWVHYQRGKSFEILGAMTSEMLKLGDANLSLFSLFLVTFLFNL